MYGADSKLVQRRVASRGVGSIGLSPGSWRLEARGSGGETRGCHCRVALRLWLVLLARLHSEKETEAFFFYGGGPGRDRVGSGENTPEFPSTNATLVSREWFR